MKKIILLHGWNYRNYTKYGCVDAWENRKDFVSALSKKFEVYKINLPGFCGEPEPKQSWNLDDFSAFLENYLYSQNIKPDYILGYSFGAAIALHWKNKLHKKEKLLLVSPAIIRRYEKPANKKIDRIKRLLPTVFTEFFRDIYLRYINNEYYAQGSQFLRTTYLNIVKADLTQELINTSPEELLLIFGSEDTATPPNILKSRLTAKALSKRIKVIEGGGHDIANTNIDEIIALIENFDKNEN